MSVRALLIDDDVRLSEALSSYLSQNDVELAHAHTGQEGLDRIERDVFDVVLLDVMMPGLDGLAVLKKLRARTKLPVIMLTARGDEADRVVGLELGADDYVAKPFSPRELLARMRAVLRRALPDAAGERMAAAGIVVDTARAQRDASTAARSI